MLAHSTDTPEEHKTEQSVFQMIYDAAIANDSAPLSQALKNAAENRNFNDLLNELDKVMCALIHDKHIDTAYCYLKQAWQQNANLRDHLIISATEEFSKNNNIESANIFLEKMKKDTDYSQENIDFMCHNLISQFSGINTVKVIALLVKNPTQDLLTHAGHMLDIDGVFQLLKKFLVEHPEWTKNLLEQYLDRMKINPQQACDYPVVANALLTIQATDPDKNNPLKDRECRELLEKARYDKQKLAQQMRLAIQCTGALDISVPSYFLVSRDPAIQFLLLILSKRISSDAIIHISKFLSEVPLTEGRLLCKKISGNKKGFLRLASPALFFEEKKEVKTENAQEKTKPKPGHTPKPKGSS